MNVDQILNKKIYIFKELLKTLFDLLKKEEDY